jgi:hypothetical protein
MRGRLRCRHGNARSGERMGEHRGVTSGVGERLGELRAGQGGRHHRRGSGPESQLTAAADDYDRPEIYSMGSHRRGTRPH